MPALEGGSPLWPPLSVFSALAPKPYPQRRSGGSGSEPPKLFFWGVVFGSIPMSGFVAHGFLIPVLELGFRRLVETLYCIVNILYNAMKETKRVVKL